MSSLSRAVAVPVRTLIFDLLFSGYKNIIKLNTFGTAQQASPPVRNPPAPFLFLETTVARNQIADRFDGCDPVLYRIVAVQNRLPKWFLPAEPF
jgi:hypothetical protein